MIVSHKHKFIFIKTNKTGGTSVEIALSRFCGPDDIITRVSPTDELLRRELGYPGPQNHRVALLRAAGHYLRYRKWPRFYNHMSAVEVRRLVGEDVWNDYFTFCFERNPWDRAISVFHWYTRGEENANLQEFIQSGGLERLKTKGSDLYREGGEVLVDHICRYERFDEELRTLSSTLGLPEALAAPRAKGGIRSQRADVRLTQQDVDYIAHRFGFEIDLCGYRFEGEMAD